MAYLIGQGGKVSVGATDFDVTDWSLNVSNEAQDTTTTGSNGWMENIAGISKIEGSVKCFYDAAAIPTDDVTPGAAVTLKLYVGSTAKFFTFSAIVTKIGIEHAAKSVVPFSFDFIGSGAITYPS